MVLLLNLLFALLAFVVVRYMMAQVGADNAVATLSGVLAGVIIFLANLGAQVV